MYCLRGCCFVENIFSTDHKAEVHTKSHMHGFVHGIPCVCEAIVELRGVITNIFIVDPTVTNVLPVTKSLCYELRQVANNQNS